MKRSGSAIDGIAVRRIAIALARRYATSNVEPVTISRDEIAPELGNWASGYALDQLFRGANVRRSLGWKPRHLDLEAQMATAPGLPWGQ